ncbi:acyl-CoA carboxylase subunit epsilon [Streptomyces sp. NPDC057280]|uniref:acyl-CoA carboxylase subunit epsilon n=1 Tax=Streptomyces sp. NPDC057280 TaxID=3346081 RepID=UPI0009A2629A|nr:hypothetical protein B1R27_05050 [Streptomyces sp. GKU 895]
MAGEKLLIRVEKGQPDEAELAAVVAVLLSLQEGEQAAPEESPAAEIDWWRRPEPYAAPDSWR